jgi:hypothetical protein
MHQEKSGNPGLQTYFYNLDHANRLSTLIVQQGDQIGRIFAY